ncbi:PREDICTED: general odorant-binding protein 71 [Polistes dominula]|uniref:General odorant-binding protein 71 n=1 Tax=Polistes dominula TaxID=743375 RepID=A0ABM1IYG1_POLDO|nr:PREDICTED: general odorant-binding protein 71 [Polistes dominula]
MKSCFLILFAFILTSYFHFGIALRCQSINQQIDDRFEKILKTCRKRNLENNNYDNDSNDSSNESNESSDSSSDSNEDDFNKKFFAKNNSRFYTNEFLNEQNDRNNRAGQSTRNANSQSYHFNNGNERSRNVDYYDTNDWGNVRNSASNRNYQDNRNQKQNNSCISQCFLNELNAVDQRGFPVQESMIRAMTERIYDLELRDYIEESIIQCFQFLHSVNRMEKCEYSQNLITCLIGKGKEQCDDWNI